MSIIPLHRQFVRTEDWPVIEDVCKAKPLEVLDGGPCQHFNATNLTGCNIEVADIAGGEERA